MHLVLRLKLRVDGRRAAVGTLCSALAEIELLLMCECYRAGEPPPDACRNSTHFTRHWADALKWTPTLYVMHDEVWRTHYVASKISSSALPIRTRTGRRIKWERGDWNVSHQTTTVLNSGSPGRSYSQRSDDAWRCGWNSFWRPRRRSRARSFGG